MTSELTFPTHIMIQTISGCNAGCFFCPYPYLKEKITFQKMDKNIFKNIIDECSKHKEVKVIMPYLMNEPLLDKELPEKITYIKQKLPQASTHILTNGVLLDNSFAQRLIDSNIDWVGFSIHGIKNETISSTMNIDAGKALKNILNFIKLSRHIKGDISDFIMVSLVKNARLDENEKEEAVNFWEEQGISRINVYSAPVSRAGNVPLLPKINNKKIYGCNSIWTEEMVHILSNGDVVLCCMDWKSEVVLGNLKKDSIRTIWKGDKYNTARKKIRGEIPAGKDFLCLRCECAHTSPVDLKKKIQLIITPPWGIERPPVGLGVISEVLESKGFDVEVLDLNIILYNKVKEEDKKYWGMDYALYWRKQEFISYLLKEYSDIFAEIKNLLRKNKDSKIAAFSVPSNSTYLMLKWVIEEIKNYSPQKWIILGGISVTVKEQREELLELIRDKIDVIVTGEGEEAISRLADKIIANKSVNDVENILVFKDKTEIKASIRNLKDLSSYPYPKYRNFPLDLYKAKNSLAVEWSRGCIGKCSFCDFKVLSKYYKRKSPRRVVDELESYKNALGKVYFSIVDSSVNADLKWLDEVCSLIIKKHLNINISGLAIPRGDMSLSLLKKMKTAGFFRLEYGTESGSDKILRLMGKTFSTKDSSRALELTKKAGLKNILYFIVGFPEETEEDFNLTLDFIRKNKDYIDFVKSVNPLFIMSGSELFSNPEKYGIEFPKENADFNWFIRNRNDFNLRMERVKKTHALLDELGIAYTTEATALPQDKTMTSEKPLLSLVTTPPWGVNNPPVGPAYLASFIKKHGYKSVVYDFNIDFYNSAPEDIKLLWHVENKNFWSDPNWFSVILEVFNRKINEAVDKILKTDTPYIGFSVVDPKERMTIEFIKRIKEKDKSKKIILGGPACLSEHSRRIFTDSIPEYIDYFVIGEGEETLLDLLDKKCSGIVKGTISKNNGTFSYTPRELIEDLDLIPHPTYEDFNLNNYQGQSLILEWSRGCRGKCAFCINYKLVSKYRIRSAKHIFQELKYHLIHNRIKNFTICDPLINGSPELLDKLCDLIIKEELNIRWTGEAAPRKDMDIPIFKKMKRAGCSKLQIGVESASDKVLRKMRKIYTSTDAEQFIKRASLAGIETEIFIMIGFPEEGEEEFQETVEFIKRNRPYINTIKSINTLHLIAGTDIYENITNYNLKPLPDKNWYYLWQTNNGNTYQIRKERGKRILETARNLGLKVLETNLEEGKQTEVEKYDIATLKKLVNSIQNLPRERRETADFILPRKKIYKAPYLVLIILLTLIAETYLWILRKMRHMIIFPGS